MDEPPPLVLSVGLAGRPWLLEFDTDEARTEIAAWLGPWAEVTRRARTAPGDACLARFASCAELPDGAPGVRRLAEGIGFRTRRLDLCTREKGEDVRAVARFRQGSAVEAVRLALRVLAARATFARGGLALHAASVRAGRGAFVFVGRAGAGKTAARCAFPAQDRLDDDLVLLARPRGRWVRLDLFDKEAPARFAPSADELPVAAVLRPERAGQLASGSAGARLSAGSFRLVPLAGAAAVRACLHVPASICVPGGERARNGLAFQAVDEASVLLERLADLAGDVSVARMEWALDDDLPARLSGLQ